MNKKRESMAVTLWRIEAIILQGLCYGVVLFAIGILLMPAAPIVVPFHRWMAARKRLHFLTRVLLVPIWMLGGCLYGVLSPFVAFCSTVADLRTVVAVEWAARNNILNPKKPNGHPLEISTAEEKAAIDMATTLSVVKDYNAEARSFGQGLPIDETEL